jgi:hypothetical protein
LAKYKVDIISGTTTEFVLGAYLYVMNDKSCTNNPMNYKDCINKPMNDKDSKNNTMNDKYCTNNTMKNKDYINKTNGCSPFSYQIISLVFSGINTSWHISVLLDSICFPFNCWNLWTWPGILKQM